MGGLRRGGRWGFSVEGGGGGGSSCSLCLRWRNLALTELSGGRVFFWREKSLGVERGSRSSSLFSFGST